MNEETRQTLDHIRNSLVLSISDYKGFEPEADLRAALAIVDRKFAELARVARRET